MAAHGEVKIAYTPEESKQGEVVVLVPGAGEHAEDWATALTQ